MKPIHYSSAQQTSASDHFANPFLTEETLSFWKNTIFSQFCHRCFPNTHISFNQLDLVFKTFYHISSTWLRPRTNLFSPPALWTCLSRQQSSDCCWVISAQELERATHVAITSISASNLNSHWTVFQQPMLDIPFWRQIQEGFWYCNFTIFKRLGLMMYWRKRYVSKRSLQRMKRS